MRISACRPQLRGHKRTVAMSAAARILTHMDNERARIDDYTKRVAELLREHHKASGLSYDVIAERSGLSRPTVERVLNAKRPITISYLNSLGKVLGFEPSELLNRAEE